MMFVCVAGLQLVLNMPPPHTHTFTQTTESVSQGHPSPPVSLNYTGAICTHADVPTGSARPGLAGGHGRLRWSWHERLGVSDLLRGLIWRLKGIVGRRLEKGRWVEGVGVYIWSLRQYDWCYFKQHKWLAWGMCLTCVDTLLKLHQMPHKRGTVASQRGLAEVAH